MRDAYCRPAPPGAAALVLALAIAPVPDAAAQRSPVSELVERHPSLAKASSPLLEARRLLAAERSQAEVEAALPLLRFDAGRALVEVRLEALDTATLAQLESLGLEVSSHSLRWARVDGWLDLERLDELAALPAVATVHPQHGAVFWTGTVDNQADATMNSGTARSQAGVDGSGVTVGVLSDSFNDLSAGSVSGTLCNRQITGTSSQTSGNISNTPGDVILHESGPGGGTDEARAIVELISDIAPGADYVVHSAAISETDFADGITELVGCGADVIVDDVLYFFEPMFQDGPVAQAAQGAVDAGVAYFSSAGNSATFGIDDAFVDSGADDDFNGFPDGSDLHDFDPGAGLDSFAAITIPDDCGIRVVMNFSEPHDGALGPGASSDLDLYLFATASVGGGVKASGITFTGCGVAPPFTGGPPSGDPVEALVYLNTTGARETVFLAVEHFCGSEDLELRFATFALGAGCSLKMDHEDDDAATGYDFENGIDFVDGLPVADGTETAIFVDPQIYGHPAAAGVVAVAASFYGEIDSGGGVDPPPGQIDVEPFSSLGGALPFYFDGSGSPLAPQVAGGGPLPRDGPPAPRIRFKPVITAPDGTNTSFFGMDIPFDTDAFPNFFGTSASAPHAAAVAALMVDLWPDIEPLPVELLLRQTGIDILQSGLDDLSGDGLIDALRAIRSGDPANPPLVDDLEFDLDGGAFFSSPPAGKLRLQAKDTLLLEDGDFTGLDGFAETIIFADGFESGDTSAWTSSSP